MNTKIDTYAKIIWEYMLLHHKIKKMDAILILGSTDLRIPKKAAELYRQGLASWVICSGGKGKISKFEFDKSEAEIFLDILIKAGVPKDKILLETCSRNGGENIIFTQKMLKEKAVDINSFILVQKPYMERRAYATFKKQWPGPEILVTSPDLSFDEFTSIDAEFKDRCINLMVGDLQRIKEYPVLGFQIEQEIPDQVWEAWERLVDLGYTEFLLK